jgi:hypothetical protein
MRDDQKDPSEKVGSPDRKTRVKGDRVIHTVAGSLYKGNVGEIPRGLTAEQWEAQRTGAKIDERNVREAAQGEHQVSAFGNINETAARPGERLNGTDEVAEARASVGGRPDHGVSDPENRES